MVDPDAEIRGAPPTGAGAGFATDANTVRGEVDRLEASGYRGQFRIDDTGRVACLACGRANPGESYKVDALHRTEGASDPADMAAVIALRCPWCGTAGTLVVMFGPGADADHARALRALSRSHP